MGKRGAPCSCPVRLQEAAIAQGGTELKSQIDLHRQAVIQALEDHLHRLEIFFFAAVTGDYHHFIGSDNANLWKIRKIRKIRKIQMSQTFQESQRRILQ
ncbi:hypothetical protein DMENIID0001_042810 [Sergentomyia squamirostris]